MVRFALALPFITAAYHASASYVVPRRPDITSSTADGLYRRQTVTVPSSLTVQQALAGYNATCTAATSPLGLQNLQADVNNLTVSSIAIQTAFQNIGAQLAFIDSEKLDGTTVFSPGWKNLTQQWTNILWASRDSATDTSATLDSFISVIMPFVVGQNDSSVIPVLEEFITETDTLKTNAVATSNNFVQLQTSLKAFALSFANFAQAQDIADNSTITNLQSQIQNLETDIASLNQQMIELGVALGVTVAATVGFSLAFPEFSFFIIAIGGAAAIGEAVALDVLSEKVGDDKSKINQLKGQITVLQQQEAAIAAARSTLGVIQNTTIPTMIDQLGGIANFWTSINTDCEASITYLQQTENQAKLQIIPPMIYWQIGVKAPCIYDAMIPALDNYANGIATSGIPPPSTVAGFTPLVKMDVAQHRLKVQSIVTKAKASIAAKVA